MLANRRWTELFWRLAALCPSSHTWVPTGWYGDSQGHLYGFVGVGTSQVGLELGSRKEKPGFKKAQESEWGKWRGTWKRVDPKQE